MRRKPTEQCMNQRGEDEFIRNDYEMERPSMVNTRDRAYPREDQVSTVKEERKCERC